MSCLPGSPWLHLWEQGEAASRHCQERRLCRCPPLPLPTPPAPCPPGRSYEGGCTGRYAPEDLKHCRCYVCGRNGHLCCQRPPTVRRVPTHTGPCGAPSSCAHAAMPPVRFLLPCRGDCVGPLGRTRAPACWAAQDVRAPVPLTGMRAGRTRDARAGPPLQRELLLLRLHAAPGRAVLVRGAAAPGGGAGRRRAARRGPQAAGPGRAALPTGHRRQVRPRGPSGTATVCGVTRLCTPPRSR